MQSSCARCGLVEELRCATMDSAAEGMLGSADGGGVSVVLENESVWSRFHSLGTEMILTERGRRMFPCCRFRLTGLQSSLSYLLILDIAPVDDCQHRWTGEAWEPDATRDTLLQSPGSFREQDLTGFKIDHEKIPRVCVHPDSPALGQRWMDGPVSFYKLKLSHRSEDGDSALVLRPMHRYQPRLCVVPVSTGPKPDIHVFTFPKTLFYAVTSYQNPLMTRLKIDCNPFMLAFREDGPSTRLIQNKLKLALTAADRQKHRSCSWKHTHGSECSEEGRKLVRDKSADSSLAAGSADGMSQPSGFRRGVKRVYRRGWRSGAKKAKAKWWTKVKYRSAALSSISDTMSMQPDLEQVDGLLFVSFTAKEALDVHVGNMRRSPTSEAESPAPEGGWLSEQEMVLLQQLQQMKNRQIIHPALQQVGLKLNLLDPAAPIDLHYLGVSLPLPSSVLSSSSHSALVSRSEKTSDLTRIKGWIEKFNSKSSADSSGHSAFSSELLDEYLEAEGQRISERAAVFSSSAASPVLYQLPVKSSSYVRTLDSVLQTKQDKYTEAWRCVRTAPEASARSSSARLRWKHSVSADVPQQRPAPSKRRGRYRRRRRTLRFNRDAVDGAPSFSSTLKCSELLEQQEQAISLGQSPTHISSERADFALSSLLTTVERVVKTRRVRTGQCVKDFCRLGCVCDSLKREARGSVHCRRVQCMFSCSCFKHKIILIRSELSSRRMQAFPVAGPGSDNRPEPAVRVSSLWQRRAGEVDPEPLFTPRAARAQLPRRGPRYHTPGPRPQPQVPEVEKDPVYLYLESMMTCARVREYNSNPPLQVHLLPAKRSAPAPEETVSGVSQLGLAASQGPGESCEAGGPEPTKVLEIISGCNWETHRSLVLKELFRCVSMNHLASLFYIDIYKVELLSKDLRKDECGSTLIYKVCVSLGQTPDKSREPRQSRKKPERSSSSQKVNKLNEKEKQHVSQTSTPDEKQQKHFPLLSRVVPAGLLRANKKTLVRSAPIKVNGKTYTQAKLILGRMGALHPANRLAAYVTGRIKPLPPNTSRALSKTLQSRTLKEMRSSNSKHTVNQENQRKEAFKMPFTRAPKGIRCTPSLRVPNHAALNPGRGANAVAPPLSSAETVLPASALPPGQQVVLQPVAGMTGVNMCQFNGQMIQLVPITAGLPVQMQTGADGSGGAQQVTQSAQMTMSMSAASQKSSSKPLPFIVPKIHGIQGNTGFTFGSIAAPGLQNGLLSKAGMFSFRICPPSAESKTAGLEQTGSTPESTGTASTLLLPGGYRLIKLPMFVSSAPVPSVCSEKSTEKSQERENPASEDPSTQQSSVSVKTEPAEDPALLCSQNDSTPVIIKVESYSADSASELPYRSGSEPEDRPVHVKIEACHNTNDNQSPQKSEDSSHHIKIEQVISDITHPLKTSEISDHGVQATDRSITCSLFEGRTSSLSQSFTVPSYTKPARPQEIQKRRRKRQASDGPGAGSDAEFNQSSSALMYSSDGWTTEDSNDWYSEDEVDIETFEECDEMMNIGLLRAKERRKTQQGAQHQWLLKCESVSAAHQVVRVMSDLTLYKRTWRLNQALKDHKQHAELERSLESLKRTLGIEEDVMMNASDLLREARQMIGALEEHSTALMAKKRALIRQHSHYQTLILQHSGTDGVFDLKRRCSDRSVDSNAESSNYSGSEGCVEVEDFSPPESPHFDQNDDSAVAGTELQKKTAAPSLPKSPSETPVHHHSVEKRRLPGIILQSFTKI